MGPLPQLQLCHPLPSPSWRRSSCWRKPGRHLSHHRRRRRFQCCQRLLPHHHYSNRRSYRCHQPDGERCCCHHYYYSGVGGERSRRSATSSPCDRIPMHCRQKRSCYYCHSLQPLCIVPPIHRGAASTTTTGPTRTHPNWAVPHHRRSWRQLRHRHDDRFFRFRGADCGGCARRFGCSGLLLLLWRACLWCHFRYGWTPGSGAKVLLTAGRCYQLQLHSCASAPPCMNRKHRAS